MNVLVTGGCGYIGASLVPRLLADGHKVTVFDTRWLGDGHLPDNPNLRVIIGDVRDTLALKDAALGQDSIIWLASLSNNQMYSVNYDLTHQVNTTIEWFDVERFIYASSVAVLDPKSDYAKDKVTCEEFLKKTPATIIRSASVCGYSPRQRLDTTVNKMVHDACRKGIITVNGGEQLRTHVHINDLCQFYSVLLTAHDIEGQTFTLVKENQRILDTARMVSDICNVPIEIQGRTDDRSYSVENTSFFKPQVQIEKSVHDLKARFDSGMWTDSETNLIYQNIKHEI